jgi:hypothetical protein
MQACVAVAIAAAGFVLMTRWDRQSLSEAPAEQTSLGRNVGERNTADPIAISETGTADGQQRVPPVTDGGQPVNAAAHEQAGAPEVSRRLSVESRDNDQGNATVAEPDWYHLRILSPEWVDSYMTDCQTPGGDACSADHDLAVQIASANQTGDGDHPDKVHATIQEYFRQIAAANNFSSVHSICSQLGCLVYVAADQKKIFGTGMNTGMGRVDFFRNLDAQPWMRAFGRSDPPRGTYRGFWSQEKRWGLLLIFYR